MILVTGATGFLGAELIHQLTSQGIKLRALKREHSIVPDLIKDNNLIDWAIADINDISALEDAFEGIEQVYHCAALVSFNPKDKTKLLHVNIEGTGNVVNLCLAFGARLLHVSSVAALGDAKKGALITEKDFWEYDGKAHAYAISKYEGEMEIWRGIAEGLDAVIVNPSVIIGAGAGFEGSGAIFKLVKDGLAYYTKGATGIVDVADVAKSMIALMNSRETAERYILSAKNYHYQQFFGEIAAGYGVKAPAKEAKPWMLGIAWRAAKLGSLFTGKPAALTRDTARSSLNESLYSNEKIKNTISIEFKEIKQTIEEICRQQD
ncbi:MAG: NAD-dependent epimerase/dehydratase family protein [Candidatus Pedobacter colombiensis]|uniref:NAD-dependent epimerase/dehydratase family protein n=1 Tax=Candidatus Pedobacter colombiensis TaxID=3121371 RepID=A0AAJ6B9C4_9SPHI|nr:NAD-dependent epimerase/dehydratase family protein [Pedobacter sp.]WEK21814.1 MAG: NAD-dependent epimerase/dehydratase family protein [Pedobacter sp.]